MNVGKWTTEEHESFIEGLEQYGKNWDLIKEKIPTRTVCQVRTHAQKYFSKLEKDKRKEVLYGQALTEEEKNRNICLRERKKVDYNKMNGDESIVVPTSSSYKRKQSHKNIRGAAVSSVIEKKTINEKSFSSKDNIHSKQEIHCKPTPIPVYQFPQSSMNHPNFMYNQYSNAIPVIIVPSSSMQHMMVVNSSNQSYFYPIQLTYNQTPINMNSMNSLYSPVLSYSIAKNTGQPDSNLSTNESKLLFDNCSSGSNAMSSPEVSCEGKNKVILEEDLFRK